jgi:cytochrome d ubiquinol oxidase subunit II
VGVVARGAAFAFRQYDDRRDEVQRRWGRIFAIASIVTPLFLGMCVGAITSGAIRVEGDRVLGGFFAPWLAPFPIACGCFVLALFAFLAAVYLTHETDDPALQDDFRLRALAAGVALAVTAAIAGLSAGAHTAGFGDRLLFSAWSIPHQGLTGVAAITALWALWTRRYALARAAAIAQAALIIMGWGLAQLPYIVAPDVTLRAAAAPNVTLLPVLLTIGGGSILLIPALYWLMKVFKLGKPG